MIFGVEKLEWCGYPMVKKFWRYVYYFWQNSRTWQTDGRTDTAWRHRPRPCIASRGNKQINETDSAAGVDAVLCRPLMPTSIHCWTEMIQFYTGWSHNAVC